MHEHTRRGGFRRPVSHVSWVHRVVGSLGLAVALLVLSAAGVTAHGGVPTLQLGAERINPGGTIELLGDMTTEGTVELSLVGGTTVRSLGNAVADYEGHFQMFVIVPVDIAAGRYTVHAESAVELASAPLVVAGPPLGGEEGQLPGQDEARAGVQPGASGPGVVESGRGASSVDGYDARPVKVSILLLIVIGAVVAALAFGALVRTRSSRMRTD